MLNNNKFGKIFFILMILIFIQSFLQYNNAFVELIGRYLDYIMPVIYGIFIAIFLTPIMEFFQKKLRIGRGISIFLTMFLIVILLIGFFGIIAPQIGKSIKDLIVKLPYMQNKIETISNNVISFLREKGLIVIGENELQSNLVKFIKENIDSLQQFGISTLVNIVGIGVAITKFLIGVFLAILILYNKEYFNVFLKNILKIICGKTRSNEVYLFLEESKIMMLKYIQGRIIVSVVVGIVTWLVMLVTSTPYALLSGMMLGVGNMIPYVGSIVAGIIAIFLVGLATPSKLIFLFLAIIVAQIVDGWIVGPKVVGETVGMNSFWIMVAILIGGSIAGPVGMFFGVPLFSSIKLIYYRLLKNEEEKNNVK